MKRTEFRETAVDKMTQVTQLQGLSDCSKFPSMSRQRSRSKSQSKTSCVFSRGNHNPEDRRRPVLNVEPKNMLFVARSHIIQVVGPLDTMQAIMSRSMQKSGRIPAQRIPNERQIQINLQGSTCFRTFNLERIRPLKSIDSGPKHCQHKIIPAPGP